MSSLADASCCHRHQQACLTAACAFPQEPPPGSLLLGLLQDTLVHHLLPKLTLKAVHSFSQSCTAARSAVRSLPDAVLLGLAEARTLALLAAPGPHQSWVLDDLCTSRRPKVCHLPQPQA